MSEFAKDVTASFIRAIEFDNQIAADKQKFSHWLLGLATAGFALALTQGDKIIALGGASETLGHSVLKGSAALFVLSALVGALIVRLVDLQIDYSRQSMTLMLRQELLLSDTKSQLSLEDVSREDAIAKITTGELLDNQNRSIFKDARQKSKRYGNWAEWALIAQQALVALGYVTIFSLVI